MRTNSTNTAVWLLSHMVLLPLAAFAQAPKPPATKPVPQSRWRTSSKKSEMDGIVTTTLALDSSSGAGGLFVRCGGGKAEVYVSLGDYAEPELGGGHSVRVRFDTEMPIAEEWSESTDNKGLFSYRPHSLIQKLLKAKRFVFEFTPYQKTAKVFSFDPVGLSRSFAPIASSCGESYGEIPYEGQTAD